MDTKKGKVDTNGKQTLKEQSKVAFYLAKRNAVFECNGKEYKLFGGSIYKNLPDCKQLKEMIKNGTVKKI